MRWRQLRRVARFAVSQGKEPGSLLAVTWRSFAEWAEVPAAGALRGSVGRPARAAGADRLRLKATCAATGVHVWSGSMSGRRINPRRCLSKSSCRFMSCSMLFHRQELTARRLGGRFSQNPLIAERNK